jgi:hypothetical protein
MPQRQSCYNSHLKGCRAPSHEDEIYDVLRRNIGIPPRRKKRLWVPNMVYESVPGHRETNVHVSAWLPPLDELQENNHTWTDVLCVDSFVSPWRESRATKICSFWSQISVHHCLNNCPDAPAAPLPGKFAWTGTQKNTTCCRAFRMSDELGIQQDTIKCRQKFLSTN